MTDRLKSILVKALIWVLALPLRVVVWCLAATLGARQHRKDLGR